MDSLFENKLEVSDERIRVLVASKNNRAINSRQRLKSATRSDVSIKVKVFGVAGLRDERLVYSLPTKTIKQLVRK